MNEGMNKMNGVLDEDQQQLQELEKEGQQNSSYLTWFLVSDTC